MSVRSTSQGHSGHSGHPAGDPGRQPCAKPRRREEASAERAATEPVDDSACDGLGGSGQRTDRARLLVDHIEAIYALIYAGVGNRVEAEELTSRVFDLAAPCLGHCTPDETRGLLVRVARSVVEDHWQALSRGPAMIPDRRDRDVACRNTTTTPTADTALPTPAQRADRLLRLLPAREREVLTYRFLLNRSVREIADMLLVTEDAVKALVYRALVLAAELERTMS
jgi:DNA-directed RNA polymerase specialized sigma24 family protein